MTAELRIGTLRLHGRPDRTRQVDARATLASLDLAPRSDDRRVLVVRQLQASLSDPAGARERLAALRRTAQRPALGEVDPRAEAVEFSDEAEVLLCLSDDVLRGRAGGRWWWTGRLPRHCTTVADTLTALWLAQPRWVPSVLTALQATTPTRLAEALGALGPRATAAVLDAILEEHLPELAGPLSPSAPPTVLTPRAQQDKANPPPAWLPLPITEVLLTTATTLAEHPAMARTPEFSRWLLEARVQPVEAPATLSSDVAEPVVDPVAEEPPVSHLQVVGESGASLPLPKEDPASDVPLAKNAVAPLRSRQRRTAPPAPEPAPQPAWQHRSWDGSGPAMKTDLATLLYAVNLVNWFDLSRISETTTGWAVVEAVGRWLLRDLPTGRRRTLLADPLLTLFAELDTRPPKVRNPVRLGAAVRPVRRFLTAHDIPVSTFTQPGQVVVSRTHVDVVLGLDQIDLRARTCGLDQDPGWVPELGRVVLFHFEGAA
jgi:hypothetical protein